MERPSQEQALRILTNGGLRKCLPGAIDGAIGGVVDGAPSRRTYQRSTNGLNILIQCHVRTLLVCTLA